MSDEFREQVRAGILDAFGFDEPPSRVARLRAWLPSQRRMRRHWLAMERAQGAARLSEAEYAAELPCRCAQIAGEMNDRLADVLPEGMRFEWTTEGQP